MSDTIKMIADGYAKLNAQTPANPQPTDKYSKAESMIEELSKLLTELSEDSSEK